MLIFEKWLFWDSNENSIYIWHGSEYVYCSYLSQVLQVFRFFSAPFIQKGPHRHGARCYCNYVSDQSCLVGSRIDISRDVKGIFNVYVTNLWFTKQYWYLPLLIGLIPSWEFNAKITNCLGCEPLKGMKLFMKHKKQEFEFCKFNMDNKYKLLSPRLN